MPAHRPARPLLAPLLALAILVVAATAAAAAGRLNPGQSFRDCPDCPDMVVAPAGSFIMGSPVGEAAALASEQRQNEGQIAPEQPQHRVSFAHPFALGKYEVTSEEFGRFVAATGYRPGATCEGLTSTGEYVLDPRFDWRSPGYPQAARQPVVCVNWNDAQAYVKWLSASTGKHYRLPSEAEWEYAARGGTTGRFWWGDSIDTGCASANVGDISGHTAYPGWGQANCDDGQVTAAPVGSYKPNPFGFYDILGNVWEWTEDCWIDNYNDAPVDGRARMTGTCDRHVRRGGAFDHFRWINRTTTRMGHVTSHQKGNIGFRVARDL